MYTSLPQVAFLALNPAVTADTHLSRAAHICSGGSPVSNQVVQHWTAKIGLMVMGAAKYLEIKDLYDLYDLYHLYHLYGVLF